VEALEKRGLRSGRTASRAVGYAQVLAAFDGTTTADRARELTAQATRRLVRRQESWFRRDHRISWLDAAGPDLVGRSMAALAAPGGHER
jgi:tRNA dimethylallyltransferase